MDSTGNSLAVGKRTFRIVPLALLVKADWNYKKEDEERSKKLVANLKRNGQVETLLVRHLPNGKMEVVNGNHRYDALAELGVKSAAVCDLGKVSKAEAMRLAVETNETNFETDYVKLSGLFKEMKLEFKEDDLLSTLPFDARELSDIEQITSFEWPQAYEKPDAQRGAAARAKTEPFVFHLTSAEQNAWTNFQARSGQPTAEAALMFAIRGESSNGQKRGNNRRTPLPPKPK
jgi:hypothetical protein